MPKKKVFLGKHLKISLTYVNYFKSEKYHFHAELLIIIYLL